MIRQIYLVPGFFGFTALGAINYFRGVSEALGESLSGRGLDYEIVECKTQPTGSLRRRAESILTMVCDNGGLEADELHFVGHSTGGLDVRLLTSPGVKLAGGPEEDAILRKTRSVVTVAAPHHGTPLATLFTTLPGRHLLELLALLATTRGGRLALYGGSRLLGLVARADDLVGRRDTFLDTWVEALLGELTHADDDPVWEFFRHVSRDQGAIIQLTPEALDLFNAAVVDARDVAYGCVITAAPQPPLHYEGADLLRLTRLFFASAFTVMHTLTSRQHRHYPYPNPGDALIDRLAEALGFPVDDGTNDGVVPSLSQIHGEVIHVARADHLDVVGQYDTGEPHSDWLPSGSRFDGRHFRAVWDAVAAAITRASHPRRRRRPGAWRRVGAPPP